MSSKLPLLDELVSKTFNLERGNEAPEKGKVAGGDPLDTTQTLHFFLNGKEYGVFHVKLSKTCLP